LIIVVDKNTSKLVKNATLIVDANKGSVVDADKVDEEYHLPNGVFLGMINALSPHRTYALSDDYYSSLTLSTGEGKRLFSNLWPNIIRIEKIEIGDGRLIGNFYFDTRDSVANSSLIIPFDPKNPENASVTRIEWLPVSKKYLYGENLKVGCHEGVNYGVDFSEPKPWNAVTSDMSVADIAIDVDCSVPETDSDFQTILALGDAELYIEKKPTGAHSYDLPTIVVAPNEGYSKSYRGGRQFATFVVKTREGNYAKFLYLDGPFILWAYQPDGSKNLDTSK